MAIEVLFTPLRKIVVEDETGTVTYQKQFPPLFRPTSWPDFWWVKYESESFFPLDEKKVTVLDTHTQKTVSVWADLCRVAYFNYKDYYFRSEIDRHSLQYDVRRFQVFVEEYDLVLQDLQAFSSEAKDPKHRSKWEEFALQIASICALVSCKRFFCFSINHEKLPFRGGSISSRGKIFLDLPESQLQKGATRSFERALWLDQQIFVAKGVYEFLDSDMSAAERVQNEMEALATLNGNEEIIQTYSQGIAFNPWQFRHFLVFQELHQTDLFTWLLVKKCPLSLQDKKDIMESLLKGLVKISARGIHFDLSMQNILLSRSPSGKIKALITDFGSFIPFAKGSGYRGLQNNIAPPEYSLKKPYSSQLDVWRLGLVFFTLWTLKHPHWWNKPDAAQTTRKLKLGWPLEELKKANVPNPLVDLINHMLIPHPEQRATPDQALSAISNVALPANP